MAVLTWVPTTLMPHVGHLWTDADATECQCRGTQGPTGLMTARCLTCIRTFGDDVAKRVPGRAVAVPSDRAGTTRNLAGGVAAGVRRTDLPVRAALRGPAVSQPQDRPMRDLRGDPPPAASPAGERVSETPGPASKAEPDPSDKTDPACPVHRSR
jgi:hypothetical protein